MADPQLSRLFERYRRENDLAALAEVFDRVSPDLLRVARHVAGRGIDPEDLLQATFLAAIERSSTFDAERPLLPWLLGILVNQSRQARRHPSTSLAEESERSIQARPDREHDAESHEIDTAVTRALRELPAHYREVLVPHLSEGKDPHIIARELGRPQGTVRAQIHRGIRMMRRLLPTGYALGGYGVVSSSSLEAVRDRVLQGAARRMGRGPEAVQELALRKAARALRRRVTAVGTAGALGVALWLAWPTSEPDPGGTAVSRGPASVEIPSEELEHAPPATPNARARVAGATEPAAENAATAAYGSVVVRVHEPDSEAPAVGTVVTLIEGSQLRWFENLRETRTDSNGVARFDRVSVGRVAARVEHGEQRRNVVVADKETAIDITCPHPIALEVVVTETDGKPIAGALVDVHAARDEPPVLTSPPTDARGSVRIDRAPNECFVTVRAPGFSTSKVAWAGRLEGAGSTARFSLALARGGLVLEGRVVDEHGAAVQDARLILAAREAAAKPTWRADGKPSFECAPLAARCDASGGFRFEGLGAEAMRLTVEAAGRATRIVTLEARENAFPFETVQLGPEASLRGRARFADGSAARTVQVEVLVDGERFARAQNSGDGAFHLGGLPAGPVTLRARAGAYGPLTTQVASLKPGQVFEWEPTLTRGETIEGRAVGQDGRTITSWLVLATPEDRSLSSTERLAHWSRAQVPAPVDDLALQTWISASGLFVVPCRSEGPHRVELRSRASWRDPPQTFVTGVRPGARDVLLRVEHERGHIQGRFVDELGRPAAMARVIAVADGSTSELVGTIDPESGRFDVETLAGSHELLAFGAGGTLFHFGTVEVTRPAAVDLGNVVVSAPSEIEVVCGIAGMRGLELIRENGLAFELVRSAPNTWRATGLQPGAYTVRGVTDDGSSFAEQVTARAGSLARVEIASR